MHQLANKNFDNTENLSHSRTVHPDIIEAFYSSTDAQEFCFKINNEIYIKNSPTCFGLITIISERTI